MLRSSHSRPKTKTYNRLAASSSAYESMRSADHAGEPFSPGGISSGEAHTPFLTLGHGCSKCQVRTNISAFAKRPARRTHELVQPRLLWGPGHSGHGARQRHQCLCRGKFRSTAHDRSTGAQALRLRGDGPEIFPERPRDRKSTRLNSSHTVISYAVFCLKKKN